MCADVLLVAQRLLAFYEGGPQPTEADEDFMDALARMREREADALRRFKRRSVNAALCKLIKEPKCNSASK